MPQYGVLYGKLNALRSDFFLPSDLKKLEEISEYEQMVAYLSSRGMLPAEAESLPRMVERGLKERLLAKVRNFRFYLPGKESELFEYFLYKYDIYNLKILLALHFSKHDRDVAQFVFPETPLFDKYAFLVDRESFVDKDMLLAFSGTKIFPFLMHTYRNYKEKGDLFFLDTVLEDEYYQSLLKLVEEVRDRDLLRMVEYVLFVHDVIWGMRMHFVYKMSKEEIFYYLVLPLPSISADKIIGLFAVERVEEFVGRLKEVLSKSLSLQVREDTGDLEEIKQALRAGLMEFLWKNSLRLKPGSLSGIVAWIFYQEMAIERCASLLYDSFMRTGEVELGEKSVLGR